MEGKARDSILNGWPDTEPPAPLASPEQIHYLPAMASRDTPARWTTPPTVDDFATIAEKAFESIPESLRKHVQNVVFRVDDFPDEETAEEMNLESYFDILGLYRGVSIDQKTTQDVAHDVDMVFLYRRPILDYWAETGEDLEHIVRHVLIHEIGHHFGFSDADMEAIEEEN